MEVDPSAVEVPISPMRRFACALQLAANDVLQRELLLAKQRGAQLEAKLEAKEETHELARRYATDRAREQEAALRAADGPRFARLACRNS